MCLQAASVPFLRPSCWSIAAAGMYTFAARVRLAAQTFPTEHGGSCVQCVRSGRTHLASLRHPATSATTGTTVHRSIHKAARCASNSSHQLNIHRPQASATHPVYQPAPIPAVPATNKLPPTMRRMERPAAYGWSACKAVLLLGVLLAPGAWAAEQGGEQWL